MTTATTTATTTTATTTSTTTGAPQRQPRPLPVHHHIDNHRCTTTITTGAPRRTKEKLHKTQSLLVVFDLVNQALVRLVYEIKYVVFRSLSKATKTPTAKKNPTNF
jgi:hypothetical protein